LTPPGGVLSTLAAQLCDGFDLTHISAGDLVREHCDHGTERGSQARRFHDGWQARPGRIRPRHRPRAEPACPRGGPRAAAPYSRRCSRASSETQAAKDEGDSKKSSWLRSAAVNCALFGALAGELEFLWRVYAKRKNPDSDVAKAFALVCATAVVAPPLRSWIKSKGYDMEA
jgi:hypothetical protein